MQALRFLGVLVASFAAAAVAQEVGGAEGGKPVNGSSNGRTDATPVPPVTPPTTRTPASGNSWFPVT